MKSTRQQFLRHSAALGAALTGMAALSDHLARAAGTAHITVWVWAINQALEAKFAASHPNISVTWGKVDVPTIRQRLLASFVTGTGAPDVTYVEAGILAALMQHAPDGLQDLGPYLAQSKIPTSDIITSAREFGVVNGKQYALPVNTNAVVILYRHDLFQKYGVNTTWKSWEDYIAAGKQLYKASGGKTRLLGDPEDLFRTIAFFLNGGYVDREGRSIINTPQAVEALKLARAVVDAGLTTGAQDFSAEWVGELKHDAIATHIGADWFVWYLRLFAVPDQKGLWRVAQIPQPKVPQQGGTWISMPKQTAHPDAAWEFIRWIALSTAGEIEEAKFCCLPAYLPTFKDPLFRQPDPFFGGQYSWAVRLAALKRTVSVVNTVNDPQITDILLAETAKVLRTKSEDAMTALRNVEQQARQKGLVK